MRVMASSAFMPGSRLAMPFRLPSQPPRALTLLMVWSGVQFNFGLHRAGAFVFVDVCHGDVAPFYNGSPFGICRAFVRVDASIRPTESGGSLKRGFSCLGQIVQPGDLLIVGSERADRARGDGVDAVVVCAAGDEQSILLGQTQQLGFVLGGCCGGWSISTPSSRPAAISSRPVPCCDTRWGAPAPPRRGRL